MPIVYRNPNNLIPYQNNAKTHPNGQIEQIVKLIERFGFPESKAIAVDEDNVILHGHGRRLAAIAANLESVPTEVIEGLSPEDKQAWRIADNAVAESEWDWAKLEQEIEQLKAVDYDLELLALNENILSQLKSLEIEENNSNYDESEDEVPDVEEVEPRCKEGEIWELGRHRLLCGDSTNELQLRQLLGDRKINMIFTDPPYGINLDTDYSGISGGWSGQIPFSKSKKYKAVHLDDRPFDPSILLNLKADEYFLWGANYYADKLNNLNESAWFVWDKTDKGKLTTVGSEFELCWSKKKHRQEIISIPWAGCMGLQYEDTRLRIHPTQKPVRLIEFFLNKFSQQDNIVVDLFLGSGSTLIACEKCDRICYGVEIDLHYCEVIMQRYEKLTGQQARRLVSEAIVQGTF